MDNKLNKSAVRDELVSTKQQMEESFDNQLGNITVTKEELEQLKAQLSSFPKYVIDREVKYYHIQKKLGVVLKERDLYIQLDNAIEFLGNLLDKQVS